MLRLYSTLHRAIVPFEPRDQGKVAIYVCGPTVQSEPHVGQEMPPLRGSPMRVLQGVLARMPQKSTAKKRKALQLLRKHRSSD